MAQDTLCLDAIQLSSTELKRPDENSLNFSTLPNQFKKQYDKPCKLIMVPGYINPYGYND